MGGDGATLRGARRPATVRVPQPPPGRPPLTPSDGLSELDDLDACFAALAHPARRHLLQVLHARGGWMTAGDLASRFSHSWPTTSRHLKVLREAGLIATERVGRERHISVESKRIRVLLDLWCSGIGLSVTDRSGAAP